MKRFEQISFALALLVHLLPVILLTPFVTLDGSAHLYNAVIMKALCFSGDNVLHRFHEFNSFPEPNWTGHLLMAMLLTVLPALLVEKVMLILLLSGMALGFRRLVYSINENSIPWLSWLIFPFLFNFTLLLGFFNFSLAMILLMWWLAWWIKHKSASPDKKTLTGIALFFVIMYFSHLLVFLLAIGSASLFSISSFQGLHNFRQRLKEALVPVLAAVPGIVLTTFYLIMKGTEGFKGEIQRMPLPKLLSDLIDARMFIAYDFTSESAWTIYFTFFLIFIFCLCLIRRDFSAKHFPAFLLFVSALLLYFMVPDSLASGGIVSVRLLMWVFLTYCLWIVSLRPPLFIHIPVALLSFVFSAGMMKIHWRTQEHLEQTARLYIDASYEIPENAVVLPLNYSSNWLYSNMPSYMGMNKHVLVLDNYEADYELFPVKWKQGFNVEKMIGNHASSSLPCITIRPFEDNFKCKIDFVSALQFPVIQDDSCTISASNQLGQLYLAPEGSELRLFKRKSD